MPQSGTRYLRITRYRRERREASFTTNHILSKPSCPYECDQISSGWALLGTHCLSHLLGFRCKRGENSINSGIFLWTKEFPTRVIQARSNGVIREADLISLCVRWYLRFLTRLSKSRRDDALNVACFDHTTMHCCPALYI